MSKEDKRRKGIQIIETLIIPVSSNMECVACLDIIPKGEEAFQSPSTQGRFYHQDCFRALIRSTGKDPDKFINIITQDSIEKN